VSFWICGHRRACSCAALRVNSTQNARAAAAIWLSSLGLPRMIDHDRRGAPSRAVAMTVGEEWMTRGSHRSSRRAAACLP
jgi:hypothetical protein